MAGQLKLTGFVSGLLRGSKQTPEGIAEDVLSYLKDDCQFFLTHNYAGQRLVYGYVYDYKKYGSIIIKQYDGFASVVDIENGEMKIRS